MSFPTLLAQGVDRLPSRLDVAPPYQVEVRRSWIDSTGRMALLKAENEYPPRDSVLQAMRPVRFRESVAPADSLLWWYSQSHGIRHPYAITTEAVEYYLGKAEQGRSRTQVRFRYTADAEFADTYKHGEQSWRDVHVIRQQLGWWHVGGRNAGLSIAMERTVVVSHSGEVLLVAGDGKASIQIH